MLAISLTIACSRYIYNAVILQAHPVRGESHNQRNATGEVATVPYIIGKKHVSSKLKNRRWKPLGIFNLTLDEMALLSWQCAEKNVGIFYLCMD